MSDTTGTVVTKAPLKGGGGVLAIIPQDLDQTWRMARMAVIGKMAPKSLVEGKDEESATAACAIAIMAGAELGLTPLMALRSYAVVNGRPSLWGDGLKAVVRQSGKCEYIRTGSDQKMGWCEAKRNDTGETKRVEFTMEQAKLAKLNVKTGPWTSGYADVMMERRATNRCLNDLFADVLGGIVDAQEAQDDGPIYEHIDPQPTRSSPPPPPPEDATDVEEFDAAAFGAAIEAKIAETTDEDALIAMWEAERVDDMLADHQDWLDNLYDLRNRRLAIFNDDSSDEPEDGEQTDEPSLPLADEGSPGDKP
jgi:hypothetical protein